MERARDEHGRATFAPSEYPPETERFALWRGKRTHPDACHTPTEARHPNVCVGGWIPSGEWWFHCGRCRPDRTDLVRRLATAGALWDEHPGSEETTLDREEAIHAAAREWETTTYAVVAFIQARRFDGDDWPTACAAAAAHFRGVESDGVRVD